jgi:hypothetical protein
MTRGLLFWVLMLLWLIFGIIGPAWYHGTYAGLPGGLLSWILLALLGWDSYGPPIKG